jgi:hypothetical protein
MVNVWFWVTSYHASSMTSEVREAYKGEHVSNIVVFDFNHITVKHGMLMIVASFYSPSRSHGSWVKQNIAVYHYLTRYNKPLILPKVTAICNILNHTPMNSTTHLAKFTCNCSGLQQCLSAEHVD